MSSKRKQVNQSREHKEKDALPLAVKHLAQLNGVDPQQIVDWKTYKCGKVVFVTANSMKFIAERIGLDFLANSDEASHDSQP
ncbi:MAG: hypothetical protein BGO78_14230 [Chloroflexi bacterium 44-23]|nr:MAG: hypothetical protein BGO78_14230 [Chloroflexi bacterium 44-23]